MNILLLYFILLNHQINDMIFYRLFSAEKLYVRICFTFESLSVTTAFVNALKYSENSATNQIALFQ